MEKISNCWIAVLLPEDDSEDIVKLAIGQHFPSIFAFLPNTFRCHDVTQPQLYIPAPHEHATAQEVTCSWASPATLSGGFHNTSPLSTLLQKVLQPQHVLAPVTPPWPGPSSSVATSAVGGRLVPTDKPSAWWYRWLGDWWLCHHSRGRQVWFWWLYQWWVNFVHCLRNIFSPLEMHMQHSIKLGIPVILENLKLHRNYMCIYTYV